MSEIEQSKIEEAQQLDDAFRNADNAMKKAKIDRDEALRKLRRFAQTYGGAIAAAGIDVPTKKPGPGKKNDD